MVKSKLPNAMLGKIWKLADVDTDGKLDMDEFALAMHLIDIKLDGHELPAQLPSHLVPPSKMNGNWAPLGGGGVDRTIDNKGGTEGEVEGMSGDWRDVDDVGRYWRAVPEVERE